MTSKQEASTTASNFALDLMRPAGNRWHRAYVLASAAALVACVLLLQAAQPAQAAIQSKRVYLVPVPVPVPIMVKQKVTAYGPRPRYPKGHYGRRPYAYPSPYAPYSSPYGPPPPAPAPYAPHSPYAAHQVLQYAAAIAAAATPSPPPAPTTGEPCPDPEKTHDRPHPLESSHSERNPFTTPLSAAASSPIASALMAPSGGPSSSLAALGALAEAGGSQATSGQLAGALNKALLALNQRHHLALGKLISGEAKMLSPTAFLGNQIEPVDTSSSAASASPDMMFDDSSRSETSSSFKSEPMNGSASNSGDSVVAIGERPKSNELSRLLQIREKLDSVAQAVDKEQQNQQRQEQQQHQHQHKHQEHQQSQQQQQQQPQLNSPSETQEQLTDLLTTISQSSRLNDRDQLLEALRIIRERQSEEVLALAAHHLGLMAR